MSDDDGPSLLERAAVKAAGISGWFARADFPGFGSDESGSAIEYANDFQSEFNSNNKSIESYASERLNPTTGYDTFAVYFHDKSGANVTRYVVADVSNGSWSNARVVASTNRSVDHWISADWYASKHTADELDTFVEEYAELNQGLTRGYQLKLVAKYGSGLESDMWARNRSDSE
ncbi:MULTISPECIES: hypothetical protein [Halorussus]|uniref:hypothetical protein n=1 Tax=Halorussus TaxID=1070314 RepID=UPI0020A1342B|nr:hypothetical protein [Halorussus vallis]USZ78633.1 hypothetical protein NGM07_25120 [Halorussus vallis]USZ78664.1 hypothetical protein NGM07_24450 [Halorussus vallis]